MMRVNLSIFNSDNVKKKISFAVASLFFVFLIWICNKGLSYLLVSDLKSYTRVMLHELYNQEDNIDVLFLGSSHCYRSLDTNITDEIFELNTFNAGTSSQYWDGSYALLVEAGKENSLKRVFVEMYYNAAGQVYDERTELKSTYLISDYMKPSYNKYRYLFQASDSEYWINGLISSRRNWRDMFEPMYVGNNLQEKQQDAYKNYSYPVNETEYYAGKGFVSSTETREKNDFLIDKDCRKIEENIFTEDDKKSLEKIIKYCKKNNIEVTFFAAPMSDFMLVNVENYDLYIQQVESFLSEYDVEYFDFNLCKNCFSSAKGEYYKDCDHLNAKGAEAFSKVFSNFFTGKIEYDELFYPNWREKISQTDIGQTYGLFFSRSEDEENNIITLRPVQYVEHDVYYSIYIRKYGEEEWKEVEILDKNSEIKIPKSKTGMLLIYVFDSALGETPVIEATIGL